GAGWASPSGRSAETAAPHAVLAAANAGGAAPACNPAPSVPSRDTSRSGFPRVPGDSRSSSHEAPNILLTDGPPADHVAPICVARHGNASDRLRRGHAELRHSTREWLDMPRNRAHKVC